jgi:hypothetical protein
MRLRIERSRRAQFLNVPGRSGHAKAERVRRYGYDR